MYNKPMLDSKIIKIKRPYRERLAAIDPNSNLILQLCCKTAKLDSNASHRSRVRWHSSSYRGNTTRFQAGRRRQWNPITQFSSLSGSRSSNRLHCFVRETNNYYKHNAWFPLLQKTRQQIREESYRSLCLQSYHLHSEFLGHIRLMKIGTNATL